MCQDKSRTRVPIDQPGTKKLPCDLEVVLKAFLSNSTGNPNCSKIWITQKPSSEILFTKTLLVMAVHLSWLIYQITKLLVI